MASPIEDYGLISDLHTGALISRSGSMDWLCFPRFDSASVFAALLGEPGHGRWLLAPAAAEPQSPAPMGAGPEAAGTNDPTRVAEGGDRTAAPDAAAAAARPAAAQPAAGNGRHVADRAVDLPYPGNGADADAEEDYYAEVPGTLAAPEYSLGGEALGRARSSQVPGPGQPAVVERAYVPSTFVLRTRWRTATGEALVTDFMPAGDRRASLVRRVQGLSGTVDMQQELILRFHYGDVVPWVFRSTDEQTGAEAIVGMAGPNAVVLHGGDLPRRAERRHRGEFTVAAGQTVDFELCWFPSHQPVPAMIDVDGALEQTTRFWQDWCSRFPYQGDYHDLVKRSLLVLRAMTHESTGGIVAAPTTSLPEQFGGERNWDYRYVWLRDAALTLETMMTHGYETEALHWRNWLLRAVAGDPEDLQIMYGLAGERDLPERVLEHLPGYAASKPVRIGNGAVCQYQGDVVGEVMVALEKMRNIGCVEDHFSWPLQKALLRYVERHLGTKDRGIWETRGESRHFTHSRVMMWAAFDRGVRAVLDHGLEGEARHWAELRDQMREEILARGFNRRINSFTQTYDGTEVDASLLVLPQVGFIKYDDDLMLGTVERLERELVDEAGLVRRYRTESGVDGLAPGEYPFLACSFWLVEQYARSGRIGDARDLMDQLVGYTNELGLLSEEYDTVNRRMAGNYPQAFSHLALIRAADAINGHAQAAV
ncbi:glycoside hydrolase family 15 protein [Arthrobacter sp. I2-34]|uniref:Glycoside hydrolase family 15 protein n=1 Tax=Arthrobacter hankyongi TaxID=2904801 RepID=A0ABS9LC69_9MICC|nr:glycoside hydrolase family 15 protein [Arthrobacter hankyongi]MCG2624278.1 glycoside hydrolase family 15 protein [Arthrobacter hankyongi]